MFLIIKHIDIEGPGTLGDFLKAREIAFRIIELGAGEELPVTLEGIDAVVVLGGPMNVYQEEQYPFLRAENDFIQKVLQEQVPYLGICLGSQLLAKAAGASVVKSPVKEIGWYHIVPTAEGLKDPFFRGFKVDDPIYHWHGDMFMVPQNGVLLATAKGCPYQALRVGKNAYGVQFHVEVTDRSIKEWCDEYIVNDLPGRHGHAQAMIADYYKHERSFLAQANNFYKNFLKIVEHAKSSPVPN